MSSFVPRNVLIGNRRDYSFLHQLGRGSFGTVYRVADQSGNQFAVKCIPRGRDIVEGKVLAEVINHRELYHPHVVRFEEVFLTRDHLCIVMEYASGGRVVDRLFNGPLRESKARRYFQQLILTVDYCHRKGVAHRDIKVDNLCLSPNGLIVCDFGYSKSTDWQSLPKTRAGSRNYMAPEVVSVRPDQRYCGMAADVWSSGVTLYVLITKRFPFCPSGDPRRASDSEIYERIMNVEYTMPPSISEELQDLFTKIFVKDPKKRITIEGIKAHPWFQRNLPDGAMELTSECLSRSRTVGQTVEEIIDIVREAECDVGYRRRDGWM